MAHLYMLMVHALFGKRSSNIIATTVYTLNPASPHSIKARFLEPSINTASFDDSLCFNAWLLSRGMKSLMGKYPYSKYQLQCLTRFLRQLGNI